MTRFSEKVQEWMGWCPMAARQDPAGEKTAEPEEKAAADAGPVARRALIFSRLSLAGAGLSWIIALAALPYLPETIPVHWNFYGEPDGFSGRLAGAFGLPILITLTAVLLFMLPRSGRMRGTFEDSRDIYAIVGFAAVSLLLGIHTVAMLSSSGADVPVAFAFPVLLGFFFIVIGSLMPYLRRNTTVGFRLPWTIRNEMVWKRTHEHGGMVLVLAGILIVLLCFVSGPRATPVSFGILMATILYITVWSYRLSRPVPVGK